MLIASFTVSWVLWFGKEVQTTCELNGMLGLYVNSVHGLFIRSKNVHIKTIACNVINILRLIHIFHHVLYKIWAIYEQAYHFGQYISIPHAVSYT